MASLVQTTNTVVNDTIVRIKPFSEQENETLSFDNNAIYKITIANARNLETGEILPPQTISIRTAFYPFYCTLDSLKMVVDTFNIPDMAMRSYIRDASKNADFIAGGKAVQDGQEVPYEVEEFVRVKATLDCLLRGFMDRTYNGGGDRYKLDVVEYENSLNANAFKDLIDGLRNALRMWQDAIRGYYNEGRVRPRATRIGLKAVDDNNVPYISVDTIMNDYTRVVPQYS